MKYFDNIQMEQMIDEIENTYNMYKTLFSNPYTKIKLSNFFAGQTELYGNCEQLPQRTINRKLNDINTNITAICYQNHPLFNPAFLYDSKLALLPNQTTDSNSVHNYSLILIECVKKYNTLPHYAKYHYLRTYYYLNLNLPLNFSPQNGKFNFRTYACPLFFAPLFFSLLHSFNPKELSHSPLKTTILENASSFTQKAFFSYFDENKPTIEDVDTTKLVDYYSNCLSLMFPEDLFNLYCYLVNEKEKTDNSSDPFSYFNGLPLKQLISQIPQLQFLSETAYKIFCSETEKLWNTEDGLLKIQNIIYVLSELEGYILKLIVKQ